MPTSFEPDSTNTPIRENLSDVKTKIYRIDALGNLVVQTQILKLNPKTGGKTSPDGHKTTQNLQSKVKF